MERNYEVRIAEVSAISLNHLSRHELYRGEIVRISTGEVAHRTKTYMDKRTARLQASRLVKNYEYHLAKHGVGFEEQEAERKANERAERDAKRKAERLVRDAAPDMLDALHRIMAHEDDLSASSAGLAVIAHARAAIAKAKGE